MTKEESHPLFEQIEVLRHLEEMNRYFLRGEGEIKQSPGKLTLVWRSPVFDEMQYVVVKLLGEAEISINGRRYPATQAGLQRGLRDIIAALKRGTPNE